MFFMESSTETDKALTTGQEFSQCMPFAAPNSGNMFPSSAGEVAVNYLKAFISIMPQFSQCFGCSLWKLEIFDLHFGHSVMTFDPHLAQCLGAGSL
jgi:hypothetical protein